MEYFPHCLYYVSSHCDPMRTLGKIWGFWRSIACAVLPTLGAWVRADPDGIPRGCWAHIPGRWGFAADAARGRCGSNDTAESAMFVIISLGPLSLYGSMADIAPARIRPCHVKTHRKCRNWIALIRTAGFIRIWIYFLRPIRLYSRG